MKNYPGYRTVRVQYIEELKCTFTEIEHLQSGASIIHIDADDPENFFCIHFQTVPYSSNGVAHILEHTVLSGSEKYPVKDAFFSMLKRSLNTFMNALTGADFTCYPAATMNRTDFYNLLDVYIDSVFHPRLTKESFLQEGWRLEFTEEKLNYQGVVFNEMKGSLSSSTTRFFEEMSKALFPTTTYGFNSGGEPKEIPTLTHEELKAFHKKYYDVSQALFFFYGDIPLESHLKFLEEKILSKHKITPKLPPIPHEKRFTHRKRVHSSYPADSETSAEKTYIGFGFLTCPCTHSLDVLALTILDTYLMGNDASPLKRALLSSKLCSQAGASLDTESLDVSYTLLLKGCEEGNATHLENIIQETLKEVANSPLDETKIESSLHSLEFEKLEIGQEGGPFGLTLFSRTALSRAHGKDPVEGLTIYKEFEEFRKKLEEDPLYLQKCLQKYFIENQHAVTLIMTPDIHLSQKELEEEKKVLDEIQSKLSEKEKQEIINQNLALKEYQEKDEDYSFLPNIALEDISKDSFSYALKNEQCGNIDIFHTEAFTNHIVYADLIFPLPKIEEDDFWIFSLFCHFAPNVGCKGRSFCENLEYIQAHTGGISVQSLLFPSAHSRTAISPSLAIRGKVLSRKKEKLFSLYYDIATNLSFHEIERLEELVNKHLTNLESSLKTNPLRYAILTAAQHLSPLDTFQEASSGISYIRKVRDLAKKPNFGKFLQEKLEQLKEHLFTGPLELVVSCQKEDLLSLQENGFEGLSELTFNEFASWKNPKTVPQTIPKAFETPTSVAFNAQAFSVVSYNDPKSAEASLIANLLDNVELHTRIREQGGAYGGGASYSPSTGLFYFYSYRDPHILATKDNFEKAFQEIASGNFTEDDLDEAKREVIQDLDTPVPPGSRAAVSYAYLRQGKTLSMRNQFREHILSAKKEALIETCKNVLLPQFETSSFVSFAGKELVQKESITTLTVERI